MRARIQDVARAAGVSVTTVSRVLNDESAVRPEKRLAVHQAIADLNYVPDRVAQSLKSRNFGTVALVVTDISIAFYAEIAGWIEQYCDERGYSLLLCNTKASEERLLRYLVQLPHRGIDGIIVCGVPYLEAPAVKPLLSSISASGPAIVVTGHRVQGMTLPTVVNDTAGGVRQALEHLWQGGRRRIGFLGGPDPEHSSIAQDRLAAFEAFGIDRAAPMDMSLARAVGYDFDAGRRIIMQLVADAPDLDAVLCGGDQIAIGAMRGLKELGRRVPADVAVVGFDDTPLARYAEPMLTSVSVNVGQIAARAVDLLIGLIEGTEPASPPMVPCELTVRASS